MIYLLLTFVAVGVAFLYLPEDMETANRLKVSGVIGLLTFILVTPLPPVLIVPVILYFGYTHRNDIQNLIDAGEKVKGIGPTPEDFLRDDVCDYNGGCEDNCKCEKGKV